MTSPQPTFDSINVKKLMQDIQSYAEKQAKFEQSDLFKLMLKTFKDSNRDRISNKEPIPEFWGPLSVESLEMFYQVMSDPPLGAKSVLSFEEQEANIQAGMLECFEKHGLNVAVNWETTEITVSTKPIDTP